MALPFTLTTSVTMAQFLTYTLGNASYLDSQGKYTCITFTRDLSAANASVAYTGVGFNASSVILIGVEPTSNIVNLNYICMNVASGTLYPGYDEYGIYMKWGGFWTKNVGNILNFYQAASTVHYAILSSIDADGFTLTWRKTGSTTGTATIIALCIR